MSSVPSRQAEQTQAGEGRKDKQVDTSVMVPMCSKYFLGLGLNPFWETVSKYIS